MDVPYIATAIAKDAVLYGSLTMKQLAMAPPYQVEEQRIVVVSDVEGEDRVDYRKCPVKPGEGCNHGPGSGDWIKINDRVRIRALCSRHAAPRAWTGCLTSVPAEPTRVGNWKLGDTYAYLIDFLDTTRHTRFPHLLPGLGHLAHLRVRSGGPRHGQSRRRGAASALPASIGCRTTPPAS